MNTHKAPDGRMSSGVIRTLNLRPDLIAPDPEAQRERVRDELHMTLTKRGIPVDRLAFKEREFVQGGATYFEVSVEHDPMTGERRDELVAAFELGQMNGRYVRRLINGSAGQELNGAQWGEELRTAQRNPWRGDACSWPNTTDPLVAFTLAYAWRTGFDDGAAAVDDDRPLKRAPYVGPATTFHHPNPNRNTTS